jgi:hypothetical protein
MYRRMPLCGVYDGILGHLREDDSLRARAVKFHDARLEGEPLHSMMHDLKENPYIKTVHGGH